MIFLQATSGLPSHTFPIPKHPASKHLHTAHADAVRTPMHQHHLARVRSDNTGRRPMRTRRTQTYKARRRGSRMSIRSFKSFQPRQLTSCKYCAAGVWSPSSNLPVSLWASPKRSPARMLNSTSHPTVLAMPVPPVSRFSKTMTLSEGSKAKPS